MFPGWLSYWRESHGNFLRSKILPQPTDLRANSGFQLREHSTQSRELLEARPELAGKKCVDFNKLRRSGRIFVFPESAMESIPEELTYVRKGRSELPMRVSMPPHILVDAGRRFAVYSEEFLAVPARQIGIASSSGKEPLLKALSLYLSSDFVTYQQFFTTPEWGISTSRATLDALKNLSVPLDSLSQKELNEWADLRDSLAEITTQEQQIFADKIAELNERVYCLLGLREADRILVHDFVTMTMQCVKGKVTKEVLAPPSESTMQSYSQRLKRELDAFIDGQPDTQHEVVALHDPHSAMLAIRLTRDKIPQPIIIQPANEETAREFAQIRERLQQRHSQWLYFNRGLRIYDRDVVYCFKPMQAMHWTQRQAILDAGEVIAETLAVEA